VEQPVEDLRFTATARSSPLAARLGNVITACDRLGMVVCSACFTASRAHLQRRGGGKAASPILSTGCSRKKATNVLIEIGQRSRSRGCVAHPIIAAPRCHELIELAQKRSGGKLLVSTSLTASMHRGGDGLRWRNSCCRMAIASTVPTGISSRARHGIPPAGRAMARRQGLTAASDGLQRGRITSNSTSRQPFRCAVEAGASWGYFDTA